MKNIAIRTNTITITPLSKAKKLKKSCLVEFLSKKAAEAKVPSESDMKIEKMHKEFMSDICWTGNQLTTNLLGEHSMKQKPRPVTKVPIIKK